MPNTIKPEQILVWVQCKECKNNYSVRLKRPMTQHNCRCHRGTFFITIEGVASKKVDVRIRVEFQGSDFVRHQLEPYEVGGNTNGFRVEIED